jgi:hypothetical protein
MSSNVKQHIEPEPRRIFLGLAGLGLIAASTPALAGGPGRRTRARTCR